VIFDIVEYILMEWTICIAGTKKSKRKQGRLRGQVLRVYLEDKVADKVVEVDGKMSAKSPFFLLVALLFLRAPGGEVTL